MATPNERRDTIGRYTFHDRTEGDTVLTITDRALAENPDTPAGRLEQLSYSANVLVRDAVTRNPNTPESTLRRYLERRIGVRSVILRNPGLSEQFLREVAARNDPKDMHTLAGRPDLTHELFHACARGGILAATTVAGRTDTPADVLTHLAYYTGWRQVAETVAENPSAPHDVRSTAARRAAEIRRAQFGD